MLRVHPRASQEIEAAFEWYSDRASWPRGVLA